MRFWYPIAIAVLVGLVFVSCAGLSSMSSNAGITMTPPVTQSQPLDGGDDGSLPDTSAPAPPDAPTDSPSPTASPSPSPSPTPEPPQTDTNCILC